MARIFTVGHSNRSLDELLGILVGAGVDQLVDVRRYPRSRYNPHFNDRPLAEALAEGGISYRHLPALGGMREEGVAASPNDGWEPGAFRNYADYAMTPAFQRAFQELLKSAQEAVAALMCAEKNWRQCHRQIIADHLIVRGVDVVHFIAPEESEIALLNRQAVPNADGTIRYPAPSPRQGSLF